MNKERLALRMESLERAWDRGLVRRNNQSKEVWENNLFHNYFGTTALAEVENLLRQDEVNAREQQRDAEEIKEQSRETQARTMSRRV